MKILVEDFNKRHIFDIRKYVEALYVDLLDLVDPLNRNVKVEMNAKAFEHFTSIFPDECEAQFSKIVEMTGNTITVEQIFTGTRFELKKMRLFIPGLGNFDLVHNSKIEPNTAIFEKSE